MPLRASWLTLVPILLLTFWLGVDHLDTRPIWQDEYYSIKDAGSEKQTPAVIWNELAERNPWHPPGFFVVLNAWGRLVSREPRVLRLLSTLFGLLTVAFTYRLGADTVSRRVGITGALLLGTSVMLVFYLDQIRVYAPLTLLTTTTLWLYLHALRRPIVSRRAWVGLALCVAGLLYAHYFGAVMLAVIGLYHLIFVPKNRRWLIIAGAFVAGGALFLPWVNVLLVALRMFLSPRDFHDRALSNVELVQVMATLFSNGVLPLLIAVLALALIARLKGSGPLWFFSAAALLLLLIVNGVFKAVPLTRVRYLLMLWPLFALVAACGFVWLARQRRWGVWVSLTLLAVWAGAGVVNVDNPDLIAGLGGGSSNFPLQHVVRDLEPVAMPDDALIGFWPAKSDVPIDEVVRYYFKQLPLTSVVISSYEAAESTVPTDLLADRNRVFVAYVPRLPVEVPDEFRSLKATLDASYQMCGALDQRPELALDVYARTPVCCGPGDAAVATFGGGQIAVTGVDDLVVSDGQVKPTIGWSMGANVPIHVYSATLQVFDSAGNKVAQADYGLPPRAFACQTTPLDVSTLAPGEYELRAGVYAWQTQERLIGVTAGGVSGDLVPVGRLSVN